MNSLSVLVLAAALGVEAGWQPLPEGGHEYTIQLEPQLLGLLAKGGEEIVSEVPPGLDVRRYRITVGTGKLARDNGPQADPLATDPPAARQPAAAEAPPARGAADRVATAPDFGTPPTDDADRYGNPPATDRYGNPSAEESAPAAAPEGSTAPPEGPTFFGDNPQTPAAGATDSDIPDAAPEGKAVDPAEASPWSDAEEESAGGAASAPRDTTAAPGKLPDDPGSSGPIQAGYDDREPKQAKAGTAETYDAEKPKLGVGEGESRPWPALIGAIVLLGASLGGNVYLAWVAWGARDKYLKTVAKYRGATA